MSLGIDPETKSISQPETYWPARNGMADGTWCAPALIVDLRPTTTLQTVVCSKLNLQSQWLAQNKVFHLRIIATSC
jgi:hypothetical protein